MSTRPRSTWRAALATTAAAALAAGCLGGGSHHAAARAHWIIAAPDVTGPPASAEIQHLVAAEAERGLPAWLTPHLQASRARQAAAFATADGRAILWYAPDARGGWCLALQSTWRPRHLGISDARYAALPASLKATLDKNPSDLTVACTGSHGSRPAPIELSYQGGNPVVGARRDPFVVWGHVDRPATRATVISADGTRKPVRLVDGFFVDVLAGSKPTDGQRPTALVATAAGGREVGRVPIVSERYWQTVAASSKPSPPVGHDCPSEPVQLIGKPPRLAHGATGFLVAFGGCDAHGNPVGPAVTNIVADNPLGELTGVLTGTVAAGTASARLRFGDGSAVTLNLDRRRFLAQIASSLMTTARRPLRVETLDASGAVAARLTISPSWVGFDSDLLG